MLPRTFGAVKVLRTLFSYILMGIWALFVTVVASFAATTTGRPKDRTPLKHYHPANAPKITACVAWIDPTLGLVARSERSTLGIMRVSTTINWDLGVFERLQADGVKWLEVYIRDIKLTYRTPVATMLEHGSRQQRFGVQLCLKLQYWDVEMPIVKPSVAAAPVAEQMSLL